MSATPIASQPRGFDVHIRSAAQAREYEAIVDRIAADGLGEVLDWGCGFGQISHMLKARSVPVTSLDYTGDGLPKGSAFDDVEIEFTAEPVKLPFGDESFDAVLSLGVLEHVWKPDDSLDEIRRVLRPGGAFYCFKLPNRRSWLEAIAKRIGLYWHGQREHDTIYTLGSARALVEAHGLRVDEARYANMLPLTIPGPLGRALGPLLWHGSRLLHGIPGLRVLATNVELVARRP